MYIAASCKCEPKENGTECACRICQDERNENSELFKYMKMMYFKSGLSVRLCTHLRKRPLLLFRKQSVKNIGFCLQKFSLESNEIITLFERSRKKKEMQELQRKLVESGNVINVYCNFVFIASFIDINIFIF